MQGGKLGLIRTDTVRSKTTDGDAIRYKYNPVHLEFMGRHENFDAIEVSEEVPNLLGQMPLEVLGFVVDARGQKLINNPAHGGERKRQVEHWGKSRGGSASGITIQKNWIANAICGTRALVRQLSA